MLDNDLLRPQVTKCVLSALQFPLSADAWYQRRRHLELDLFCVLNSQLLIPPCILALHLAPFCFIL
jgi:hypothetical protein